LKKAITIGLAFVFLLGLAVPVMADSAVEPPEVNIVLPEGEEATVEKMVTLPTVEKKIDVLLLEDETGSFLSQIDGLKSVAPDIWDAMAGSGSDFTMGVAGFKDFAQLPWGVQPDGYPGDWVYRLTQDLTGNKAEFVDGVDDLEANGGGDGPEAQLEALHYLATPGHPAIDSNGDGDALDACDTATGQQPTWREGTQRVVILATDTSCHLQGDPPAPGWPGCAETASAAQMATYLSVAGITVIGLVPGGYGTFDCIDTLADGTGGSVQDIGSSGEDIMQAILIALGLTTDVWFEVDAEDGLNVDIEPVVIYDAVVGSTVVFAETISLDADVEGVACAKVTFYANTYPEEGHEVGTQTICVSEGCLDIKPGSYPNSINRKGNGVIPVALLGSADFDVTTVDVETLEFGPGLATPVHDLTDPDVFADHLQDVNYDGNLDLVSHYRTKNARLEGDTACLYYKTVGGDVIQSCCDSIRLVK